MQHSQNCLDASLGRVSLALPELPFACNAHCIWFAFRVRCVTMPLDSSFLGLAGIPWLLRVGRHGIACYACLGLPGMLSTHGSLSLKHGCQGLPLTARSPHTSYGATYLFNYHGAGYLFDCAMQRTRA